MKKILRTIVMMSLIIVCLSYPVRASNTHHVWYRNQVAVLMYHHLDRMPQGNVTITPQLFREQIWCLKKRGMQFVDLDQVKELLQGGHVPDNAVLVTFDDGYESFYTEAFAFLQQLGVPFVQFVITDKLTVPSAGLRYLTADEILSMMNKSPASTIQCHTDSLHEEISNGRSLLTEHLLVDRYRPETAVEYDARIMRDARKCIHQIESLTGEHADTIAYPYGYHSADAIAALQKAGIRYGFTTEAGLVNKRSNAMQIPRINAGNPSVKPRNLFRSIVSRAGVGKH